MAAPAGLVQVDGARQLRKTLKEAGDDLSDLKAAHKDAAAIAVKGILPLVPVVSGKLRDTVRAAGTNTAGIVRAGKKAVPYAGAIQWGRKLWPSMIAYPNPPRHRHYAFIKPRLFMTEGAKDTEPQWVGIYETAVAKALEKVEGI